MTLVSLGAASCGSSDKSNARAEGGAAGEGMPLGSGGSDARGGSAAEGGVPSRGAAAGMAGTGEGDAGAPDSLGGAGGAPNSLGGAGGAPNSLGGAGAAGEGGAAPTGLHLFNTGVDDNGVVLAGGSVDPHYLLLQSPDTTYMGPDAIVTTSIADGYWVAQSDASKWIAPTPNQSYPGADPCNASGVYVWRTSFDLTGHDPETFRITGSWAADNYGTDVLLNGATTGLAAGGYAPLTPFTIESGFVAGVNTLDFEVTDLGCPTGLRVELSAELGVGGAGGGSGQ